MASNNCPLERDEQLEFIHYINSHYKGVYVNHSANEGSRKPHYVEFLKQMGMRPGHPDIEIMVPNEKYHGLFIEMKRQKGGAVSEAQKKCIAELNANGYRAVVCRGAAEAKKELDEYMKGVHNGRKKNVCKNDN